MTHRSASLLAWAHPAPSSHPWPRQPWRAWPAQERPRPWASPGRLHWVLPTGQRARPEPASSSIAHATWCHPHSNLAPESSSPSGRAGSPSLGILGRSFCFSEAHEASSHTSIAEDRQSSSLPETGPGAQMPRLAYLDSFDRVPSVIYDSKNHHVASTHRSWQKCHTIYIHSFCAETSLSAPWPG